MVWAYFLVVGDSVYWGTFWVQSLRDWARGRRSTCLCKCIGFWRICRWTISGLARFWGRTWGLIGFRGTITIFAGTHHSAITPHSASLFKFNSVSLLGVFLSISPSFKTNRHFSSHCVFIFLPLLRFAF